MHSMKSTKKPNEVGQKNPELEVQQNFRAGESDQNITEFNHGQKKKARKRKTEKETDEIMKPNKHSRRDKPAY